MRASHGLQAGGDGVILDICLCHTILASRGPNRQHDQFGIPRGIVHICNPSVMLNGTVIRPLFSKEVEENLEGDQQDDANKDVPYDRAFVRATEGFAAHKEDYAHYQRELPRDRHTIDHLFGT